MRKALFYAVTAVLLLILQSVFVKFIEIRGVMPDFFLTVLVYLSLMRGEFYGMNFGFFSGLVADVFSAGPFGAGALVRTIMGYVTGLFHRKLDAGNRVTQFGLVLFFAFFDYWVMYLMRLFLKGEDAGGFLLPSFIYALYCGMLAPFVFTLFSAWERLWRMDG